jgi:hypothetical protein
MFSWCSELRLAKRWNESSFPVNEQETASALYKKLLNLYPRGFRERLGESMQQTFNDLYKERKQQAEQGLFGFVLWTFIETAIGIIRERVLLIKEMTLMKNALTNLSSSAIISFLLVLPFMILEWATRSNLPRSNLDITGYVTMWLLPMLFILILMPIVRNIRAGKKFMANPIFLLFKVVFLVILLRAWGGFIIDQWPCFLGGSGC